MCESGGVGEESPTALRLLARLAMCSYSDEMTDLTRTFVIEA